MAPGFSKAGQYLDRMWADAERNPEIAGCEYSSLSLFVYHIYFITWHTIEEPLASALRFMF